MWRASPRAPGAIAIILVSIAFLLASCGAGDDAGEGSTPSAAPEEQAGAPAEQPAGPEQPPAAAAEPEAPSPLQPWSPRGLVTARLTREAAAEDGASRASYRLEGAVELVTDDAPRGLDLRFDPEGTAWMARDPWIIAVEFAFAEDPSPPVPHDGYNGTIIARAGESEEVLNLVLTPGNARIFLTPGIVGFAPEGLSIVLGEGIMVEDLVLSARATIGEETIMAAIPADLGTMNFYRTDLWRRPDYELFVWNAVPSVLMLDFADYDVQKRMFGRLGFFVAVAGEVGQVYEYSYYENMHAYNAQAYKTEDLALFFNALVERNLEPTQEEAFLRDLLLDYGIISRAADGDFGTGEGAIISVSQATFRPLRQQLLQHEAAHGLFYVDETYREAIYSIWETMEPDLLAWWELFLGNKGRLDSRQNYDGYNTENLVTMVDEMHAHTIQLPYRAVPWYFHDYYMGVMRRVLPDSQELLDRIASDHTESFIALRRRIAEAFAASTGIEGGLMLAVYPESYGQYRR